MKKRIVCMTLVVVTLVFCLFPSVALAKRRIDPAIVPVTASTNSMLVGKQTILTPASLNGVWHWDPYMVSLVINDDGSATVTGLHSGYTTVFYSVGWGDAFIPLAILQSRNPDVINTDVNSNTGINWAS